MANMIKTPTKAISVISGESTKELEEVGKAFDKAVGNITKGSAETLLVLNIVLRKMAKMKKGKKIGFDFGTQKEFLLTRIK